MVERHFVADAPGKLWLSDITYIHTKEGFLYLCVIIDVASRKIIAWSMDTTMKTKLVIDAFWMALVTQPPKAGCVFHSERGVPDVSGEFRSLLRCYGLCQRMSRKGNCWDNAPAESFFATLKRESEAGETYASISDARTDIFRYVEGYDNPMRPHSAIGYPSPNEREEMFQLIAAA